MDDDAVTGNIRQAGFTRLSYGLFLRDREIPDGEWAWRRRVGAWLLVLPDTACFTGLTAARLRGWWLPQLPDWVPLFVSVPKGGRGPRRVGLVVSRPTRSDDHRPESVHQLPVDTAVEVLLRCSRELGVLDMVVMLDRALRLGHVSEDEVRRAGSSGRPGSPRLREALKLADRRSESPWESVLRVFHHVIGVPVDVQLRLEHRGRFVARADLRVRGTAFLHEYDGAGHRDAATHADDLTRDRKIVEAGWVRRGYTAADLVVRPASTMAEIDRALGRRSRMSRLRRWNRLLETSTYSSTGRERLRNRWVRAMGLHEWSQTPG